MNYLIAEQNTTQAHTANSFHKSCRKHCANNQIAASLTLAQLPAARNPRGERRRARFKFSYAVENPFCCVVYLKREFAYGGGAHYLKGSLKSEREKTAAQRVLMLQKKRGKRKEMRKRLLNGLQASLCTRLKERREMASYACRRNLCHDEGTGCQPAEFLFTFQMSRILRYATTCDCGGVPTPVSFHDEETFVNTSRKILMCTLLHVTRSSQVENYYPQKR